MKNRTLVILLLSSLLLTVGCESRVSEVPNEVQMPEVDIQPTAESLPDVESPVYEVKKLSAGSSTDIGARRTAIDGSPINLTPSEAEAYNEMMKEYYYSYECTILRVINTLYRVRDDIDTFANANYSTDEHKTLRGLIEGAIAGRVQTEYITSITNPNHPLGLNFYGMSNDIVRLFKSYPDEMAGEDGLVELMKWICFDEQRSFIRSDDAYAVENLYAALFPNVGEVMLDGHTLTLDGYDGEFIVSYGEYDLWLYRPMADMAIYSGSAEIREGYSGVVKVAPINEYGAVGKCQVVYVGE